MIFNESIKKSSRFFYYILLRLFFTYVMSPDICFSPTEKLLTLKSSRVISRRAKCECYKDSYKSKLNKASQSEMKHRQTGLERVVQFSELTILIASILKPARRMEEKKNRVTRERKNRVERRNFAQTFHTELHRNCMKRRSHYVARSGGLTF